MAKSSCRRAFTSTLEQLAARDERLFLICSDSRGSVTATAFATLYPRRFIEVGIAEQNAVGIAAGLASVGKTVFVAGPACFLTARSYEQIKIDVAYNHFDVKIVGVSAGVSYGPLGGTHTALHDFAAMRTLPHLEVFAPSDSTQTAFITEYLAASGSPAYIRMGRGDVADVYAPAESFDIHRAKEVCRGSDICLIACGEMVYPAKEAATILAHRGISARVLDMFCLKPADTEAIVKAAQETGAIVTIEEHSIHGGLGELVCHVTARYCPVPVSVMGFPDTAYKVGGSSALFTHYGLDAAAIATEAERTLTNAHETGAAKPIVAK